MTVAGHPFRTHTRWAAVLTLGLAVLPWSAAGPTTQLWLVASAVLLLGLPHGAYDAWLIVERQRTPARIGLVLTAYLLAVVGVFFAWSLAPGWALGVFLLVSIVHFGRGDARTARFGLPFVASALGRGSWVVLGPIARGGPEIESVLGVLLGSTARGARWAESLGVWFAPLAMTWIVLVAWAVLRAPGRRSEVAAEGVALGVLVALAPPLVAFTVYFCLWHSARHLLQVRWSGLAGGWGAVVRRSLPAQVIAVALGLWAWGGLTAGDAGEAAVHVLFVGLAAVTVPHVVLVDALGLVERPR